MYDFNFWQNGPVKDTKENPVNVSILHCIYNVSRNEKESSEPNKSSESRNVLFYITKKGMSPHTRSRGAPNTFI